MKSIHVSTKLLLAALSITALAHASDFTGVYARIDKVILEPDGDSADRVQVWGLFAIAERGNPNEYLAPARGYLYFKIDRNPQATRNEWNDLKQVAGSHEIVAFGMRGNYPRLRKPDEKPENAEAYPVNTGVHKVGSRTDYAPVRALLDFKN